MLGRRDLIRMGAGGMLAQALPARRARAVIWLWMEGGAGQADTWDPKPDIAGNPGAIETSVPGIRISRRLPLCAGQMAHLAVIRSLKSDTVHPDLSRYVMRTGTKPTCFDADPAAGTIVAFELGRKDAAVPLFVAIGSTGIPVSGAFPDFCHPHPLGDPGKPPAEAGVRRALLAVQNRAWEDAHRGQEAVARIRSARERSLELEAPALRKVLDLGDEPPDLVRRYRGGFGRNCLLARRLVQAGSAFVEVTLGGWERVDVRDDVAGELDGGMGPLVGDLAEKGMLADTVVVCCGPHGREPGGARRPRGDGFSVVLAGGAAGGGRVIGDTGRDGTECRDSVSVGAWFATIYRACGIRHDTTYNALGRKSRYVPFHARPVDGIF